MIGTDHYGTLVEATTYFDNRLHATAWSAAAPVDRTKALIAATRIIDALNFKGHKATVATLLAADPDATVAEVRAQNVAQVLEFPRGTDTETPEAIKVATYEIAHALLDGVDPELELENLSVSSQGYESVRTTYSRNQVPVEHIVNGVPSAAAWRLLRPFLRDDDTVKLSRVS